MNNCVLYIYPCMHNIFYIVSVDWRTIVILSSSQRLFQFSREVFRWCGKQSLACLDCLGQLGQPRCQSSYHRPHKNAAKLSMYLKVEPQFLWNNKPGFCFGSVSWSMALPMAFLGHHHFATKTREVNKMNTCGGFPTVPAQKPRVIRMARH